MDVATNLLVKITAQLTEKRLFLATAESCTGGLLGHMITDLPGASDFYLGGHIAYSNHAKRIWLKIPTETLDVFGAVSRETVLAMAQGIRGAFSEQVSAEKIIGVSISGIAGPSGGSVAKPVGTVWIAVSSATRDKAYPFLFKGSREEIKRQSALQALKLLNEHLMEIKI